MNILIPMAGEGSRFKINGYELPKPLITVDGEPMIKRAIDTLNIDARYIFVTRKYENEENNELLNKTLKEISPNCIIHQIDYLTEGASATCLTVKDKIDNDDPLIITNCDQLMEWDADNFIKFIKNDHDGIVVTYDSDDPKNSFIEIGSDGNATRLTEKDPISNLALIGLHYWKRGKDFVRSAEKMITSKLKSKNEYYIAPTYNLLIKEGMKIKNYHLEKGEYIPIGTPEDLKIYVGKNEFKLNKPRTIICDLDGTILKHAHKYSNLNYMKPELVEGVNKKFDEWDSLGYKIILMTGRKESGREITERHLAELGIPYDMLIMGAGNGQRVLINDKITEDHFDRAIAVNVVTDEGFENIKWEDFYL